MSLKSGFKSSEFYGIAAYIASQKINIDFGELIGLADGVIENVSGAGDPVSQALVVGYVLFRFFMKWRESAK